MSLESPAAPTTVHNLAVWPNPTGIRTSGCHRSHWASSPGRYQVRWAGSGGENNGRSSPIRSRSTVIPRSQPIRSAITVACISGKSPNSLRISGSNPSTLEPCGDRSYRGGVSERNTARTVFRATPNLLAIVLIPSPSALCSRRISAQSSTLINLQSSWPESSQDRTSSTISGGPARRGSKFGR